MVEGIYPEKTCTYTLLRKLQSKVFSGNMYSTVIICSSAAQLIEYWTVEWKVGGLIPRPGNFFLFQLNEEVTEQEKQ